MTDIYLAAGLRTPFVKGGGAFAGHDALALSAPVASAMAARARPDFVIWGEVIPDATLSNIARELIFAAGLDPTIPAFSTTLACSTSFVGVIEAAGMVGRGGTHLALVGGVETMSHVPIALKTGVADRLIGLFARDPAGATAMLGGLTAGDFNLPLKAWANRVSGRSQGEQHRRHRPHLRHPPRGPGPLGPAQPPGGGRRPGRRLLRRPDPAVWWRRP
jgi:acetyl-CoA C-acetyltransferase